jgi:hypothetical protein
MAMELIHLRRMLDEAAIAGYLASMTGFLEGRIGPDGRAIYQEPCPGNPPGCIRYYYSRATGCAYDYDTRGWTVEPAYCALLFDVMGSPAYRPVMTFLDALEDGGTLADLYGYWPPPEDPEYPWTIADTSVVNMSIIFWALATQATERDRRGTPVELVLDDLEPGPPPPPGPPGPPPVAAVPLTVQPNPAPGACVLRFALALPCEGSLEIYDAGGRRVRQLDAGWFQRGARATGWDGLDDQGYLASAGVYFARLRAGERDETQPFVLVR